MGLNPTGFDASVAEKTDVIAFLHTQKTIYAMRLIGSMHHSIPIRLRVKIPPDERFFSSFAYAKDKRINETIDWEASSRIFAKTLGDSN